MLARGLRARGLSRCTASIGTMIEVPRAALTAGEIAGAADFFSFGTNDLTQMTWGFSRDDVEAAFFHAVPRQGHLRHLAVRVAGPSRASGRLVEIAVERGRAARPDLKLGVCGEHGGDPDSVHFFHEVGLDYVSCSPFRVPVARLEAGRAAARRGAHRLLTAGPGRVPARRPQGAADGQPCVVLMTRGGAGREPGGAGRRCRRPGRRPADRAPRRWPSGGRRGRTPARPPTRSWCSARRSTTASRRRSSRPGWSTR